MTGLLPLALALMSPLLCFVRPAGAADRAVPWNPKFKPAVSRERALHLARKYGGDDVRSSRFGQGAVVRMNRDHSPGEWRLQFIGAPIEKYGKHFKNVVVSFHKGKPNDGVRVRVVRGIMAWLKNPK